MIWTILCNLKLNGIVLWPFYTSVLVKGLIVENLTAIYFINTPFYTYVYISLYYVDVFKKCQSQTPLAPF